MKKLLLFVALIVASILSYSQSNTWSVKFSNAIISRYTPTIDAMTGKGWEYSNSIILHGIEKVNNWVSDTNYLNYIKKYIDVYVDSTGTIAPSALSSTMDKIHPGLLCLYLYQQTGQTKYKTAATNLKNYLFDTTIFKKTPDGGYWHKNDGTYNNVMMLDGIYMAQPFLAKYGSMFNDTTCLNTATFQTLLLASHVYDSTEHLVKHAWDYSKTKPWANPVTGASSEVWSRGLGWYVMAIVDILRFLPASHPDYSKLKTLLNNLAIGVKNTQDPTTGLWYQVVDKQDSTGNYLETSGSGICIYALKIAADSNWIDTSYRAVARKGWAGLQKKISTYTDGKPAIDSFAPAMSVQNNYKAYISYLPVNCPTATGTQNPHGYCGLLMAASVMEFPLASLPVEFISISAQTANAVNHILWQVAEEKNITEYIIQRSSNGIDFSNVGKVQAQGLNNYEWNDNTNVTGYYRIQAIEKTGATEYSTIVAIKAGNDSNYGMVISPNPVKNKTVNIQLNQLPKGNYTIKILSTNGQVIYTSHITNQGNYTYESLLLPATTAKAVYFVQLSGNNIEISKQIIVD